MKEKILTDTVEELLTGDKGLQLSSEQVAGKEFAGEKITAILTSAPGNKEPIGGVKVETENGWFAARSSGTENIYKIYTESFLGKEHLESIIRGSTNYR